MPSEEVQNTTQHTREAYTSATMKIGPRISSRSNQDPPFQLCQGTLTTVCIHNSGSLFTRFLGSTTLTPLSKLAYMLLNHPALAVGPYFLKTVQCLHQGLSNKRR
jgi:hypothetical protein